MTKYLAILCSLAILGAGCVATPQQTNKTPPRESNTVTQGTELDWSGRGLTALPSEIFSRTELVKLNLSHNQLTGAPPSQIGQLMNLTSLDLSQNALTGLPAELGQLKKLEVLDVSNNQLTGLPMELGQLTKLRTLNISGNHYSTRDLDAITARLPSTKIIR